MKRCPTCNRTYQDDTLVYCLEDGTQLSRGYDPQATVAAPPVTAVLPPDAVSRSPATSVDTATLPPLAGNKKSRDGILWVLIGLMIVLILVGLVGVFGYLAFKARDKTATQPSLAAANTPVTNANASSASANANPKTEAPPADVNNLSWLDGVWKGEGYQSDTKTTWAVVLTVHDRIFAVDYPNIPCSGKWNLNNGTSRTASFTELITKNATRCANNSHVLLEKVSDSEISCKYTHAGSRVVIANATLSRTVQ